MPIAGLQTRFAQVGVIRLGQQVPTNSGKKRPEKLETFRLTSPSKPLITKVAELYGGEVKPWQHPSGPQFEVITTAREIPVYVPPQVIDPNYELWGNKYRARKCDGITESMRNAPCLCEDGPDGHTHEFDHDQCSVCPVKRACKATTRVSLMLAEVGSLGIWKLESHGWNFASEMPMLAEAIANAAAPIPGRLELQLREKNVLTFPANGSEKVDPRKYMVPVIHFDNLTPGEAFGVLEAGTNKRAAVGGNRREAIGAGADADQPDWLTLIGEADNADAINNLMDRMKSAGVSDHSLVEAWKARAAELSEAPKPAAQPARTVKAAEPVVDAEVVDGEPEPDVKALWNDVLELAGQRGWNVPAVAAKFQAHTGFDFRDDDKVTGFVMRDFRDAVKSGAVK